MPAIRTIYNPGVGIAYFITHLKTGKEIKASTLTVRDVEQKPCRSSQSTEKGQEFFKMKSGSKKNGFVYYKFMNSIIHEKCLSDDGQWIFTGKKFSGEILPRIVDIDKKDIVKVSRPAPQDNKVRYKVNTIDVDAVVMSDAKISEKVNSTSSDEFSNEQFTNLLNNN